MNRPTFTTGGNRLSKLIVHDIYRGVSNCIENSGERFHYKVVTAAEIISVIKRRNMYSNIQWTDQQQSDFDRYWKSHYGKKIPNSWHKIYESINGSYCVQYIPEMIFTTQIEKVMNDYRYASVLADKSLVESFAKVAGCHVPDTILLCSKGVYFDNKHRPISYEKACKIINDYKHSIILKPTVDSGSGKSVRFLTAEDHVDVGRLIIEMGSDFIVQEAIKQHPTFSLLNPSSVNTLRVMTYILNNNLYHIPIACRMGNGNSKVDNIHAGGLVAGVLDDGCMLSTAYQLGYGDTKIKYNKHPITGVEFKGIVLPSINKVIKTAYEIHGRFPRLGIASWDFTVDENNNPIFIEVNLINQSIWFPQIVHGKGGFGKNTSELLELIRFGKRIL